MPVIFEAAQPHAQTNGRSADNLIGKLENLGVAVPKDVAAEICSSGRKEMRRRSIAVARRTLGQIRDFTDRRISASVALDIESFYPGPVSVKVAAELMYELAGASAGYSNPLFKDSS